MGRRHEQAVGRLEALLDEPARDLEAALLGGQAHATERDHHHGDEAQEREAHPAQVVALGRGAVRVEAEHRAHRAQAVEAGVAGVDHGVGDVVDQAQHLGAEVGGHHQGNGGGVGLRHEGHVREHRSGNAAEAGQW